MRKPGLLIAVALFVLSNALYSQTTISGKITEAAGLPVPFAVVTLKKVTDTNERNSNTDSLGYFFFQKVVTGVYTIRVSSIGYESYNLDLTVVNDTSLIIQLQQDNKELTSVTVTGTKATIERTADKTIFNLANSVTASGSDVLQAIGQIPGVRINNNEIGIVGKGVTRVMINNRLIQLQGEDLAHYLKSIAANQILKIELITNPPARYDADGNAGLINIVTKHSKLQGYSGNLQLSSKYYLPGQSSVYGTRTFGEAGGSANLAYNSNRWSLYGSFNQVWDRHLEGFRFDLNYPNQHWQQSDTGLYTHNAFSVVAGADYKASSSLTIGASYSGGRDVYDGSDHVRNPIYNSAGQLDSLLRTYAHYHPIALPAALNIHADIKLDSTGKQLFLNADYFNYYRNDVSDFESNSYDGNGNYKPGGKTLYFDRNKQNIVVYTVKADVDWPTSFANYSFGGKLSFISEYSNAFYYNKTSNGDLVYNSNLSNEFNYDENTQSLYTSMNKDMGKWKLQAGLRGELTQTKGYSYTINTTTLKNYFKLYPTLQVNYIANTDNNFSFALGRRVNRPSFWSLNPFKSLFTAYSYGEGNPYLQPEYSTNIEVAHSYKTLLRTALFANKTSNGFVNVTFPSADTNLVYTKPQNFIRTFRIGLSESISFKPLTWWETNILATIYHTDAQSSLSEIKGAKRMGAYLSTNNSLYFNQQKTIAAEINFWYQFPEIDHIGRTYRYYKMDAGIKTSALKKKLDIALNVNDVFRSSAMAYSYTVNNIPQTFTNFQIMRYLQLSINYRFGGISGGANKRVSGNEEEKGRVH